ncbi:DUF1259 domain-containing protein [Streptomyces sp. enrichment culture]|uniref:DUF1259 domain-containing protein n=1 Tax=Streptomyces sp. enrichment culture TaxID=1795815 RepID=UPI003F570D22
MTVRDKGDVRVSPSRRRLLVAAAAAPVLAGAGPGAASAEAAWSQPVRPAPTVESDWSKVAEVLGRAGTMADDSVYRVRFARQDLPVITYGVTLFLGSYAAFARYDDGRTLVMGSMAVTEAELQHATDALHVGGLEVTAVHKHLLAHEPAMWWTHFHGHAEDPLPLARSVSAALAVTTTPSTPSAASQPPVDLDADAIEDTLNAKGVNDSGIYRFTFNRRETITDHGRVLPPATGMTTLLSFYPLGDRRAAVNGDFAVTAGEVRNVLTALRRGGIDIVELHNHGLTEEPRLFFAHFWATGDGVALARALRAAVDATNTGPAA